MKTNILFSLLVFCCSFFTIFPANADWRDKIPLLKYSPRYFGANAFPFPELMGGKLSPRWEVELRGEYHKMTGDKTKDVFARLYIPIAKGRAGVSLYGVIQEWYETSPEVRDERNAVDVKSPIPCHGEFYIELPLSGAEK